MIDNTGPFWDPLNEGDEEDEDLEDLLDIDKGL